MQRWAFVALATITMLLLVFGTGALYNMDVRIAHTERIIKEHAPMNSRASFVQINGIDGMPHIFPRKHDESAREWAARVRRIIDGKEDMSHYKCTTLTGCNVAGGEIKVCTPCMVGEPEAACQARHDAEVEAFCEEFECDCD